jgi:hypothetical protein
MGELRALVESIAPVNAALADHQNSLVRQYVIIRRRFDDAAFTVALYASFEKFIESLVAAFARLESRRVKYTELPSKLVKKHLLRTAEMLSRGHLGEGRYIGLSELDVVKNLFECLSDAGPYSLNDAAIVAHDANLRVGEIDALFATIGIENVCERVRQTDALLACYREVKNLDADPPGGVPTIFIEESIKEIVERRNQIAHRGGNPLNLLGADKMRDAVEFIYAFARSVYAITVGHYLESHHAASVGRAELVQRRGDGPFNHGTVVVVEAPEQRIFVGQPVFVIIRAIGDSAASSTDGKVKPAQDTGGGKRQPGQQHYVTGARWGRIQSLKVDDSVLQEVSPETVALNGIGIGLDFKCPRKAKLVALPNEDDIVWSPLDVEVNTVVEVADEGVEVPEQPG